jgi:hypothetical protein
MTEPSRMIRLFSSRVPPDWLQQPGPGPGPGWPGDFDILDPQPAQIQLADIAHGLAGKFRFAGQSPIRKTVARHSLEVADRCTAPIAKVWGLFHDAAEAYLGDIPTPHKRVMEIAGRSLADIEVGILGAIAARFALPCDVPMEIALEINAADKWALHRDLRTLWHDFAGGEKIAMLPESGRVCHDRAAWLLAAGGAVAEMRRIHRGEEEGLGIG